jgi:hypothetical protein
MTSIYSIRITGVLVSLFCMLAAAPAAAQFYQDPPSELSFLSTVLKVRKDPAYEIWGEVKFREAPLTRQGKHWFVLAQTEKGTDPVTEWNKIKPAFLESGWSVVKEYRTGGLLEVLQYAKNGVQAWANVDTDGYPLMFRIDLVEVVPLPFTLTLAAPAATPEKVATNVGDFPYLASLPGSKFHNGGADTTTPFRVRPAGAEQAEVVANGTLFRNYDMPGISNIMLTFAYHDALTRGGWEIVEEKNAEIRAHYAKNGRNIWAMVSPNGPGMYTINVADARPERPWARYCWPAWP